MRANLAGGWRSAAFPAVAVLFLYGLPALAQDAAGPGGTTSGYDPRRADTPSSKVAKETTTSNTDDSTGDEDRVNDRFQPKGVNLGRFLLLPEFTAAGAYNSNVFVTQNNVKSDFVTKVAPSFKLQSRFDVHALNVSGEFESINYATYNSDDQINARVAVDGRYDITRGSEIDGYATYFRQHEDRGSPDAVNGVSPTPFSGAVGQITGKTTQGHWLFTSEAAVTRYDFENVATSTGTIIDNGGRNRSEYRVTGRAGYEIYPGYYGLAELTGNRREYDRAIDFGGVNRSSQGYVAYSGLGVDLTQLIRGDFLVGYFEQSYDSGVLRPVSGPSVKAVFNWTPDRQTLIVPAAERIVLESTTRNTSGILRTDVTVLARREIRRNLIASVFGGIYYDEYEGTGQSAWNYEARGSLTYAVTREVFFGGEVIYRERDTSSATISNPYNQIVASLRIGYRM